MRHQRLGRHLRAIPLRGPRDEPPSRQDLVRNQSGVLTLDIGDQVVVGPALNDVAATQDDDLVAIADRGQPVGDDQAGAASPTQIVIDDALGPRVQRARGLIEDHQAGVARRARAIWSR